MRKAAKTIRGFLQKYRGSLIPDKEISDFEALAQRFDECFAKCDYELAADAADEMLERFPAATYRHFVTHKSGPWVATLRRTSRLEQTVDKLDRLLHDVPDLNVVCDNAPGTAERIMKQRERNIERGLPSVVLIPQGKSGSVTLGTVFTQGFSLPSVAYSMIHQQVIPSWAADYARGGAAYVTHLEPTPENVRRLKNAGLNKVIVHTRDPRQVLLSFVHHIDRYPEDFPFMGEGWGDLPLEEKIDKAIRFWARNTLGWIDGWVNASDGIDILFSTFEEFKRSPEELIERYLEFYGADRALFDPQHVFSKEIEADNHFRKGEVDEWRRVFSPQQIERINEKISDRLREKFNWV